MTKYENPGVIVESAPCGNIDELRSLNASFLVFNATNKAVTGLDEELQRQFSSYSRAQL